MRLQTGYTKTYTEKEDHESFDWRKELLLCIKDPLLTGEDHRRLVLKAKEWPTCAVGNQCSIIPRNCDGAPMDNELAAYGISFLNKVNSRDFHGAISVLNYIEERSSFLIKQIKMNTIPVLTDELKAAILKEATLLKENCSVAELAALNLENFDPTLPDGCVHGQMHGACHSERAIELLNLSAVPYSTKIDEYVAPTEENFDKRKPFVVGHDDVYSVLEFFMFNDETIRAEVLAFLQGETDTIAF